MKKFFSIFAAFLFAGSMFAATYSLEQVTSVAAGKSYVIVRNSRALTCKGLEGGRVQTTAEYLTVGLEGTESYVWTLEEAEGGFYIKNADGLYVTNTSKTDISFAAKASSVWTIAFTGDVALISNKSNDNRFLGESSDGSNEYKAYAKANLSQYGHDFTIYGLKEEDPSKPALSAKKIDFGAVVIEYDVDNYVLDTMLEVTAANLTAAIDVTNGEYVTATETSLPAEGGTLHLHVIAAPGAFEDTIQLASGELAIKVAIIGSVKQKKAPGAPGEFVVFEDEIVEGDYIIVSGTTAMKAAVNDSRLGYASVSIADGAISTEDAAIVWHIAKSGDYWTIYNAAEKLYAAGTGSKNKADLIARGTDDKALWTVFVNKGKYEFVNKQNTANKVNATLRLNGSFGFACYSTATGNSLSLYKGTPVTPTAIENTEAEVKAVKFYENGQLVIIKNGVKYNALGVEIR